MANKKKAAKAESDDKPSETEEWPMEGKTVALANGVKPPTVSGVINIGMDHSIRVPSEEMQRAGFVPYESRGGKYFDKTQELLRQYPGVYKPVKEKGD